MPSRLLSHARKKWTDRRNRLLSDSASTKNGQHMTFPVELYRPIIEHVESAKDLYSLLFVSSFFHLEAEPLLYRTVSLSIRPRIRRASRTFHLHRFLEQILLCDRLALYVRDFSISGDPLPEETRNLLEQALQHMHNLKNLEISTQPNSRLSFSGCRFQLHTLVMRNMGINDSTFLQNQKELTTLDIPKCPYLPLSSDTLPKLAILSASFRGSIDFAINRPLRALRLMEWPQARLVMRLEIRQQSLRSLRLLFSSPAQGSSELLEAFPSLRFLHIDLRCGRGVWTEFGKTLFTFLPRLAFLEKFILSMKPSMNTQFPTDSKQDGIRAAGKIFDISKSLQVFAYETFEWRQRHRALKSYWILVRMQWVRGAKGYEDYPENDDEWRDSQWC